MGLAIKNLNSTFVETEGSTLKLTKEGEQLASLSNYYGRVEGNWYFTC